MPAEKQYKYNTVINYIMKYIQDNDLSDGDKLPTEQQLSSLLHVSRVSIQQGIKKLEKDGFVYRIQGSGTYVRKIADRKESSVMIPLVMHAEFNALHGFDIIRGAQEYLFSHSCHLSPHCLKNDKMQPLNCEEMINYLVERGNHCIMILLPEVEHAEFFRRHMRGGVRFVFLDTPLDDFFGCHTVYSDHALGGYLVTKHLIDLGHRDIALFSPVDFGANINPNFIHQFEGYRHALLEHGIAYREDYVFEECQATPEGFNEMVERLLAMKPHPTAIFCLNDATADWMTDILEARGIRIPEDISVAGFDNHDIHRPVTTVQQDFYGIGRYGAELALQLLNNPDYPVTRQILPVSLIKRSTTGKYRKD